MEIEQVDRDAALAALNHAFRNAEIGGDFDLADLAHHFRLARLAECERMIAIVRDAVHSFQEEDGYQLAAQIRVRLDEMEHADEFVRVGRIGE